VRESIRVARSILIKILEQARKDAAHECCGLLAGRDGVITEIFPARNALASATAYEISPRDLFTLFREIRAKNLVFLGIYHSHPFGENKPSPTDIDRAYYPDAAYFIVSPAPNAPRPVRAFRIVSGVATEILIQEPA
jgi:[CysO sulfur-carrier protein]-S-L-cysteine hydrolase